MSAGQPQVAHREVNANSVEELVSIAALSPPRGEPVQCVAPVRASRQKICLFFRCENPKSKSPARTGEFMYIDTSWFCQTVWVDHFSPLCASRTAKTPLLIREKIIVSLYSTGVTMF